VSALSAIRLSPRDRFALAFGAGVMLLLVALGRGMPALLGWTRDHRARATAAAAELARAEHSVRNLARTRRVLSQAESRLAAYDSALLAGHTPASAGAALAALLSEAASVSEAALGAVQLSADTAARSVLARASARASVSGDLESVALFLETLEEGPQLTAVRELSITPSQPFVAPGQREMLRLEITVEGLFRAATQERRP
jgi:hypothetical protein